MPEEIEQKYVIPRPDVRQVDMQALEGAVSTAPPASPPHALEAAPAVTEVEARNIHQILDLLGQIIETRFGPIARIRIRHLEEEEIRRLLLASLPPTLTLGDPSLTEMLGETPSAETLEELRLPLERILAYAFPDPDTIHAEAIVFDVHAHPGLKAQWFQRDLSKGYFALDVFQKLLGTSPFAFDPLSVRTSFPKLQQGRVNVLCSTIYALEKEALFDMRILRGIRMPPFLSSQIVGLFKRLPWLLAALALAVAGVAGFFAVQLFVAAASAVLIVVGAVLVLLAAIALAIAGALLVLHVRWILPVLIRLVIQPEYFEATQSSLERVEQQVRHAHEHGQPIRIARSVEELEEGLRAINAAKRESRTQEGNLPEPLVLIHALEGAHCLQGPLASARLAEIKRKANLDLDTTAESWALQHDQAVEDEVMENLMALYRSGVAMIGLAHYYPNIVCQSVFSYPERAVNLINPLRWEHNWHDVTLGLTRIGTQVVQEMLRLGIIIDITHTSPTTRRDVYDLVDAYNDGQGKLHAVAASHVGVQGIHKHPYNLADWEIEWLAAHHGVIGIMWSLFWLSGHEGLKLGLGYITRTIDYILRLLGEDGNHVIGFGSDLDGFSDPPDDLWDARRWPILTQFLTAEYELDDRGQTHRRYTPEQLRAFIGGNMLRQIQAGWGKKLEGEKPDLIAQLGSLNNHLAVTAADQLRAKGWLSDGSLKGAILRGANLVSADLTEADLRGVDLREANLDDAILHDVKLDETTILPDDLLNLMT